MYDITYYILLINILYTSYFFADEPLPQDYREILNNLSKNWITTEINHRVSKKASEEFWRIADKAFHRLYLAKGNNGPKIPQFAQIRNKMSEEKVPKINMKFGYQCKETGEITTVDDATKTPVSQFPPCSYKRLYEIASVNVSSNCSCVIGNTQLSLFHLKTALD